MSMQLIWFRQDLRIQDHAALWHATQAGPCIAFVAISFGQWALHHDAAVKIDFYLRQLQELKKQLKNLNIPLVIQEVSFWKDIPEVISKLIQKLDIECLHANIEVGVNELKRDAEVQQLLEKYNKTFELYHDRTLFPVGAVRNKTQQPYQVFTAFKKKCYELLSLGLPQCYPQIEVQVDLPNNEIWDESVLTITHEYPECVQKQQAHWPVSEEYALTLLDDFINDKVIIAKKANLDGAHIGQGDLSVSEARQILGPEAWLGLSINTLAQLEHAHNNHLSELDYFGLGPVFATSTKPDHASPIGIKGLNVLAQASHLPTVAIGGINLTNAPQVYDTSCDGIAVVSAICAAENPKLAAQLLLAEHKGALR